ncbi:MAG: general secretion pathway protein G [Phycisphaerales bacterium]|jgi:general secretion pathway protein G
MTTTRPHALPVSRRAFSLLELTLVLLIIGLLSAVAAVSFAGAGERARVKTTKATMNQFKQQLRIFATEKTSYPASLSELVPDFIEADNSGNAPVDAWKRPYYYQLTPGAAHEFDLISAGKDGEFETADDVNLWDPAFDN